jgi:hypothetical protein
VNIAAYASNGAIGRGTGSRNPKKEYWEDLNEDINFYRTVMDFAGDGRD